MKELKKLEELMGPRISGSEGIVGWGEWEVWHPVLAEVGRLAKRGRNAVVAIDGRCGSGKTGLARLLESLFLCNVLHMDDFYLPLHLRPENWQEIPGGNMDFERLRREILLPLGEGRGVLYRPYCCARGEMGEGVRLEPRPLTIVEGSYSQHPSMGVIYDLTVFLTCSDEIQRRRLQIREGEGFAAFEQQWIPLEENYFRIFAVESKSSLQVDTSSLTDTRNI